MENQHLVNSLLQKKYVTSMSYKLEPSIWSRAMGQRIPCFDRCQLMITWMLNIRNQSWMSPSGYYLDYSRHVARLLRRRAYAPTSNTASHDNHEKINSWVSFCFPYGYGAPLLEKDALVGRRTLDRIIAANVISFKLSVFPLPVSVTHPISLIT